MSSYETFKRFSQSNSEQERFRNGREILLGRSSEKKNGCAHAMLIPRRKKY